MAAFYGTLLRHGRAVAGQFHHNPQMSARCLSVVHGTMKALQPKVQKFVEDNVAIMKPDNIHICDGSDMENVMLMDLLQKMGMAKPLPKYDNCWLVKTDPADVARVESKTVICTKDKSETIPTPLEGVKGQVGHWISPEDLDNAFNDRFPGCMRGRTMYVIPFSMGPVGSPLAKIGIELTDSPYVVACMRIMTRMGSHVLDALDQSNFVRCQHSIGAPFPLHKELINNWPCNPGKTMIAHIPETEEIISYGSGYGGNSLLGKKCFALRIGSTIAKREGWLAEHMLILGITNPQGVKKYVAAAFPSACGKTNLAMMTPSLPGYKVECVGDDIAWMRFDEEGNLRAINPEAGFFGVAPGTSMKTNPHAMDTIQKNTVFTNVAETSDGGVYWEGLEKETDLKNLKVTSWRNKEWTPESKEAAAHPNARFCTPAAQCPIMDPEWESPRGVPISAILFGGRRPEGVPLVYESFNWNHGVFVGGAMRSESTAAAEHKAKVIMHDPFAMRPFFGYNIGDYMSHWLSMQDTPDRKLPKIFHVNWFRKSSEGKFLWPGFGENARVIDWIIRRVEGEDNAQPSPIGYIPKAGTVNLEGLKENINMDELFHLPRDFWQNEVSEIRKYFNEQINVDLPEAIGAELSSLEHRVNNM